MLRFLSGCAVTAIAFWVFANRPEVVHRAIAVARDQIQLAARNFASSEKEGDEGTEAPPHQSAATEIDYDRSRRLAVTMRDLSWDELWQVMDEDDYDRRAAAAQVLLERAHIPLSAEGAREIQRRYLRSNRTETVQSGFSYLGLLALQDVPPEPILRLAKGYVERNPREPACDNALWALGELGSEELVPYFFQIIEQEDRYGAAARERAFCCLVQCGRYSQARRRELVPDLLRIYETETDGQTRAWTLQALAECAPDARARSIDEWRRWWSRQ